MPASAPPTRFLELPGFQPDALFFATRTTLSMLLAYYVAFAAQVSAASSAGICVAIVAQPSTGMSTAKAIYRIIGTLVGGCVGVALVAAFPQDRVMLLAGFALWLALCTFVATLLRDFRSYGAALSGYTVGIITIGVIDAPQLALTAALDRVAAILIGIGSVLLVSRLLSGTGAFNALVAELHDRTEAMAALAADALDGKPVGDDMAMVRIAAGVAALQTQASYTAVELPDGQLRANGARHAIAALLAMVSASRAIAGTIGPGQGISAEVRTWLHGVADALRTDRGRTDERSSDCAPRQPAPMPHCPAEALLLERAEELLASYDDALAGLRTLTHADQAMPPVRLQVARDPVAALFGALRVLISVGFGAMFCVLAGWGGAAATPAALQDAGALIFGDDALHLQQQVVLGRAADGAVDERDLDAGAPELLDQQDLVGVAPREPVRGMHVDPVDLAQGRRVAQAVHRRARQRRPAAPLVHIGVVRADRGTIGCGPLPQGRELACHRVVAHLALARHARVEGSRDPTHSQPSSSPAGPLCLRSWAASRPERQPASGGAGSAPGARRPRPGTAARSSPPRTTRAPPARDPCCAGPWTPSSVRPGVRRLCPVTGSDRKPSPYQARKERRSNKARHSKVATSWEELSPGSSAPCSWRRTTSGRSSAAT